MRKKWCLAAFKFTHTPSSIANDRKKHPCHLQNNLHSLTWYRSAQIVFTFTKRTGYLVWYGIEACAMAGRRDRTNWLVVCTFLHKINFPPLNCFKNYDCDLASNLTITPRLALFHGPYFSICSLLSSLFAKKLCNIFHLNCNTISNDMHSFTAVIVNVCLFAF